MVGTQYGAVAGLACIVLTLVLYLIGPEKVFSLWYFAGFAIIVILKIVAVRAVWKAKNNYIVFKEALQCAFMVSVVSLLMWTVFVHVLIAVIDPSLVDISKKVAIERTTGMMEKFKAPEDKIDEVLDKLEEQDYNPKISKDAMNYAFALMVGFVFAAIVAGIFHLISKDNKPAPAAPTS